MIYGLYKNWNILNLNVREYNKLRNCLEIGEMQMNLQEIAYQNKDIASKALAEFCTQNAKVKSVSF